MMKKFVSYYKPYKVLFMFDMLAALLVALLGLGFPIITQKVTKQFIPNKQLNYLLICGGILIICYLIRMFLKYFIQSYGHIMGVRMQADMRRDMFNKLQKLPYSYYDENETGEIMSRMTNDLMNVSELAHHGPENIFICGFSIIISFAYLLTIDWRLTLIIFSCLPLLAIISLVMRKKMKRSFMETRKSVAVINSSLESSITGIRVTKSFNNEDEELKKFEVGNNDFVKHRSVAYKAMGRFHSSTSFVTDLFNVIVLIIGGIFVYYNKIDLADLLTFIVSINLFLTPLITLINFVEQYQDGITGFRRFLDIMEQPEETVNENAITIEEVQGHIEFKNVSFNYETTQGVLNNISFKLEKGKTIALVGPSGGGKSTICHLIPNFYKISDGNILIDDININDITLTSLRRNIGVVAQDVFLFNGTIKENILYGKLDASDEDVFDAAKKANIHNHILKLENGYDTHVGERGVKLSGGQKQRLAIARVFLKNPPILILDEATSALDNATEILIQKALDDLSVGRTCIVVAHRLSTIKNADEIFYVSDGQITESGTHDELLEKQGNYYNLHKAQFYR